MWTASVRCSMRCASKRSARWAASLTLTSPRPLGGPGRAKSLRSLTMRSMRWALSCISRTNVGMVSRISEYGNPPSDNPPSCCAARPGAPLRPPRRSRARALQQHELVGIINFVRHTRHQRPECRHLVGLDELHLLLSRRLFEAFAFRQITDNASEIMILVRCPTRERDLQGKFLGVLAQAHHFPDSPTSGECPVATHSANAWASGSRSRVGRSRRNGCPRSRRARSRIIRQLPHSRTPRFRLCRRRRSLH